MNISSLFLNAANEYPNHIAIIDKKSSIDYAQLQKDVIETAAYFKKKGIKEGDRVLVFVPMSVDLYRIVLALFYCGATAVFLDEWVSKKRLELCCEIADCQGFIGVFKARVFSLFSKQLRKIPIKLNLGKKVNEVIPITELDPNSAALITFTTGSTGRPKAAKRTHGFLKIQFDALLDEIEPKVDDVDMPALPIVLFMNLGMGCTSVIADYKMSKPEKSDISKVVSQLDTHKVNRITSSPFFITKLTEYGNEKGLNFEKIEKVFTGGAPVFPSAAKSYKDVFKATEINIVYGSTEVEPISSIRAKELISRGETLEHGLPVGKAYHLSNVRVIAISDEPIPAQTEESFSSMILEPGSIGEIVVSGPHVLKEYYNNEEAFRANKILVGDTIYHRTGDSGTIIKDEIYLTGRCAQLIQKGDELISPFIIENQLQEIDGVEIGTILKLKEEIVLVIETTFSLEKITQKTAHIPSDNVKIVAKIPRDLRHNSKIDYPQLVKMISN
jgi:acyl-CoA synthetase (AMP-forming)/AMP-acid ligase II